MTERTQMISASVLHGIYEEEVDRESAYEILQKKADHADFWSITGHALEYACHAVGLPELPVRQELLEAYLELECYPEVPHVLETLKTRGLRTAILSNGTPGMIESAVNNAGISELVDAVYSVEEVGIFKPAPKVYQLAVDTLTLQASEISFMSSNAWDVAGAAKFGLRVVWINRFKQPSERLPGKPAVELADLSGLAELLV